MSNDGGWFRDLRKLLKAVSRLLMRWGSGFRIGKSCDMIWREWGCI